MSLRNTITQSDTVSIAKALLGCSLMCKTSEGLAGGIIVETEAYLGYADPASHSFRGETRRNAVMFGPPGHAYVYFTYGMHYCINVVTSRQGIGEAVLIRALEPTTGLELMEARRHQSNPLQLCSGPAKLTQALGITAFHNGLSLFGSELTIASRPMDPEIVTTTRIGITQARDLPLRFYIANSPYISRK